MNRPGYVPLADFDSGLAPIGLTARRGTDRNGKILSNSANGVIVSAVNVLCQNGPSDSPIHDTRIEKEEIQSLANSVADSALAGRCRSVNCDGIHSNCLTQKWGAAKGAIVEVESMDVRGRGLYKL